MRLPSALTLFLPVLQVAAMSQFPILPKPPTPASSSSGIPSLADHLTITSSASIFYSYARELSLSSLFADENANITLLVPTNRAVMALARKPHQGPQSEIEISEQEFDALSKENVQRWVSAHILPQPVAELQPQSYPTMLDGKSVTFKALARVLAEAPSWSKVVLEDGIQILDRKPASNGFLYMIDGTVLIDE